MNIDHQIASVIFHAIDNGIIVVDKNLSIVAWNRWLEIFTNKTQKEVIGKKLDELYDYINIKKLNRRIQTALVTNNPTFYTTDQNEFLIDIPYNNITNGSFTSMQQNVTIVPFDIKNEQVAIFIYDNTSVCEKNAKLHKLNAELKELSNKDPLTGLYNRRFFSEESSRALSLVSRNNTSLSVVMMDIDKFKNINDTYGHSCGDDVITSVASILKKHLRSSDTSARFGGEEFVLLLRDTNGENAMKVAENLRKEMENTFVDCDDNIIKFTMSFGVAQYDGDRANQNIENLIAQADKALYEAKNSGRNRVVLA